MNARRVHWVEREEGVFGGGDIRDSPPVSALGDAGFAVDFVTPSAASASVADGAVDCLVYPVGNDGLASAVSFLDGLAGADAPVVVFAVDGDGTLSHGTFAHRVIAAGAAEYLPASGDPAGLTVEGDFVAAVERTAAATRRRRERGRAATQLRALFDNAPDPIVEYEFADGEPVATAANRAFTETFGYDRGAVVGEPMNDCIVPDGKEAEAETLDERVAAGERVAVELERETAAGVREFLFRNIAVETGGDGADGYAVYVDITEQKEREHRLQRQNERLEEFASVVGHDLRNPMGAVKHRIEMSRETGELDYLEDALGGLDRMDDLLSDLLRLARQGEEVGRTEPVSVATVAESAWSHVATDGATLTVADDAVVEADRGRLTQLFENLFINAIEHGGQGDEGRARATVTVGVGSDGCLYVADDGCGIPVAKREEVFTSGYSTGSDGTGYGLAIVRQVARAHGWEVGVTESATDGARFEFRGLEYSENTE